VSGESNDGERRDRLLGYARDIGAQATHDLIGEPLRLDADGRLDPMDADRIDDAFRESGLKVDREQRVLNGRVRMLASLTHSETTVEVSVVNRDDYGHSQSRWLPHPAIRSCCAHCDQPVHYPSGAVIRCWFCHRLTIFSYVRRVPEAVPE